MNSNKKKFLFTTIIAIISIINIFNIPFNIKNYYNSIDKFKTEDLRYLNTFEEKFKKGGKDYIINKLSTSNKENETLFIHLAEFYSLAKSQRIEKEMKLEEEVDKNIQIFQENKINIDQMGKTNVTQCVKCVVEINKNSIKMGGDEFTFYLADKYLTNYVANTSDGGIFSKIKPKAFSKFFALKCKIIAYSVNDIFYEKI